MELAISKFSLIRIPANIPHLICKVSSHDNRGIQIKPQTKSIKSSSFSSKCSTNKLIPPVGLYGENKFSKSLLYGQDTRNTVQIHAHQVASDDSDSSILTNVLRFAWASYKFTRPYTVGPQIIATTCLYARVLLENPELFKVSHLLFKAIPGLLLVTLSFAYFSGINQIYDADIDRVNKPYLPIPSGELSPKQAWFLMISCVLGSMLILWLTNADLITTSICCFGLLLGTIYSVPPFRFKKSALGTSIINSMLPGVIHNIGVLYATRASLGLPFQWSPPALFITIFVTMFFVVTANIKDLPDVEGDMKHNIRTLPAVYGPRIVTFLFTGILLVNYIAPIVIAICVPQTFKLYLMAPAHGIFSLLLLLKAKKLDKANYSKEECGNFSGLLWKLIGLEYLLFTVI